MMIVGKNESKRLATTRRVRNFEPGTPSRRSASNFRRFRASTTVSATNNKKIKTENEANASNCWFESGFRNGRSKEVCGRITAKTSTTLMDSKMTAFFRLEALGRIGVGLDRRDTLPKSAIPAATNSL